MQSRPATQHASRPVRFGRLISSLAMALLLFGCAAQTAFREGKGLLEQDKIEPGLKKIQEASLLAPTNAQYRETYLQTRDRVIRTWLTQADQLQAKGQLNDAEQLYQRILNLVPGNDRALAGKQAINTEQRHRTQLKEVNALIEKKDTPTAEAKLRAILSENPHQAEALALRQSLEQKATEAPLASKLAAAYKKPITIEFKDVPLRQIFDVISRTSGLNFIFDRDIRLDQKFSIFLKNSNIESAVYFILLSNQFEQQILDANTILIFPNTPAKQKDYQEVMVKTFFLANAEVKAVANSIKTILKTRDVVIDEKLNMLVMRDNAEVIKQAEKLIALHDVAEPEVMLEVEILEVNRTRILNLGIAWPDNLTLTPITGAGGQLTLNDLRTNLSSRTISAPLGGATINAKKTDGDNNLLANPRIRARNHEKAKITIGDRVPLISSNTVNGVVSEQITYIDVGLKLDVEPSIYLDNDVAIKIGLEVSTLGEKTITKSGSEVYRIGSRTANTVLRLKDGETQVLAGLINDNDRRNARKIPGLGEIPILDRLFGSTEDNVDKSEIVLSITPRIIRNIQRPAASLSEFRAGTDSSSRQRPDSSFASVVGRGNTTPGGFTPPGVPGAANPNNPNNPNNQIPSNTGPGGSNINNPGTDPNIKPSTSTNPPNQPVVTNIGGNPIIINQPNQLRFQGQTRVTVGDTFLVQLTLSADQPISSLPLALGFDSKILQVVGITEGSFLKQGGAQTNFTSRIDPNGQILISGTRSGQNGATSAADVVSVTFRALAASNNTSIQVLTAAPIATGGRALTVQLPPAHVVNVVP
jgi:general secretion pathway protein D